MMQHHANRMLMMAKDIADGLAGTRIGLVSSYDPSNYSVKVRIQPEDKETGWLPLLSPWVGNGWGMFAPPSIGDLIEIQFQEDGEEAGFACQRFFNDSDRPLNVPSGEFWLQHKNGQFFKLLNNGTAVFTDGHGATITLNGDGTITSAATTWTHNGNLKVSGDITDTYNTNTRTVAGMRSVYNGHTHTDPQGGSVSTPTTSM